MSLAMAHAVFDVEQRTAGALKLVGDPLLIVGMHAAKPAVRTVTQFVQGAPEGPHRVAAPIDMVASDVVVVDDLAERLDEGVIATVE